MCSFTREDIDLEAIRARIARMSDRELLKYGQSAAWMVERIDRATWLVQLEMAGAEWRRRHGAAPTGAVIGAGHSRRRAETQQPVGRIRERMRAASGSME